MKIGDRFEDDYNNIVEVISYDFTGLNRDIVYCQFVNRPRKKITKEMILKDKTLLHYCFAIWGFDTKNFNLLLR